MSSIALPDYLQTRWERLRPILERNGGRLDYDELARIFDCQRQSVADYISKMRRYGLPVPLQRVDSAIRKREIREQWKLIKPLIRDGELDYDQVAEVLGIERGQVASLLSWMRNQYGFPVPTKKRPEPNMPYGACPDCKHPLQLWQREDGSSRWCPYCAWDEELDGCGRNQEERRA